MSELLFVVEASHSSGIGHLMRCLALAQAAEERGLNSVFFVPEYAKDVCKARHDWCGRIIIVEPNDDATVAQIKERIATQNAVALILDGYHFSDQFVSQLALLPVPLVLLDDIENGICKYADVIVNAAGENLKNHYRVLNTNAQLCMGSQYRLLRREFRQTPVLPVSQRKSLTINFGGSDPKHFTLPVLKAISESLANTPIRVVTGPGFLPLASLQHFIQQSPSPIQHIHNCQDMADVWVHSRLTIAAAGGAQFELAACQSPSVLVVVADNQLNATREASQQGWCDMWDARKSLAIPQLVDKVVTLWNDEARLEKMHKCAAQFSFVTGADTLLDTLNH
tara:strand:- start:287 stop:1300 length:1014 start_codon:yes stop_codon:yes gene_type:complete